MNETVDDNDILHQMLLKIEKEDDMEEKLAIILFSAELKVFNRLP